MIENLIIYAVVGLLAYVIFSRKETIRVVNYDDKVIEYVGGRPMLVDKRR